MTEDSISGALERMERRAEIAMKHTKEDMDYEKAEGWKRAVEHYTCAAEALKEIRKYRAIGTIEECKKSVTVRNQITEIVNRQLVAGKNNYKETNACFYEIAKVIQDNY